MYPVAKKAKERLISLQNHRKPQELEAPGAPSENGGAGGIEKSKINIEEARWHSHTPTPLSPPQQKMSCFFSVEGHLRASGLED